MVLKAVQRLERVCVAGPGRALGVAALLASPMPLLAQAAPSQPPAASPNLAAPPAPAVPPVGAPNPLAQPTLAAPSDTGFVQPPAPPAQPELAAFPETAAPTGVVADVNRVYGDDADTLGGFDILAGVGFNASGSLAIEYDNNIGRLSPGEPINPRFKSRTDFRFTPLISADFGRAFGRQRLFLSGRVGRDFYVRNSILDRTRVGLDGGLQWTLGTRCSGRVQGGFEERGTRLSDFEEVIPSSQTRSVFLLNGGCATATGLGFNVGYDRLALDNSVESRKTSDNRASGFNGSAFYRLGNRGDIRVSGSTRRSRFPNQLLPDGSPNGVGFQSLSLGGGYRVGNSLRVSADLGNSWVNPDNPLSESFSGLTYNVGLTYSGPRLGANVSAGRSVSAGAGGFTGYQLSNSFQAAVNYTLGQRISLATGFSTQDQSNRGNEGLIGAPTIDDFRLTRLFGAADYRLNRIFSGGIDVNWQKRSSTPSTFDYSATRVVLTLRARI